MAELGPAVVIEDDDDIRNALEVVLMQAGFDVVSTATGREGVQAVRENWPTVVTLDIGLPDIDGIEVLRRIRLLSDCYVVMLSGRTEEPDALMALQGGADDYIFKPFRPRELRARISAMLRRPRFAMGGPAHPSTTPVPGGLHPMRYDGGDWPAGVTSLSGHIPSGVLGRAPHPGSHAPGPAGAVGAQGPDPAARRGLLLDPRTRTARLAGEELVLTRTEFDVLRELVQAGGDVRTKAQLVRVARGDQLRGETYVSAADEHAVEGHIGNLRRKLSKDPLSNRWIRTVRGVGYRLVADPPDAHAQGSQSQR